VLAYFSQNNIKLALINTITLPFIGVNERVVSNCYLLVKFILICVIQIHLTLVSSPNAFSLLPSFPPSANQPNTLLTR
jgi:hypothetical protein